MSFSNLLEHRALDWAFSSSPVVRPEAWYVALFTTPSTDEVPGDEPVVGAYVRIPAVLVREDSTVKNSARVEFPRSTAPWGNVTHFGVFDAETGGNMLCHGQLDEPRNIGNNDVFVFEVGAMEITLG